MSTSTRWDADACREEAVELRIIAEHLAAIRQQGATEAMEAQGWR